MGACEHHSWKMIYDAPVSDEARCVYCGVRGKIVPEPAPVDHLVRAQEHVNQAGSYDPTRADKVSQWTLIAVKEIIAHLKGRDGG